MVPQTPKERYASLRGDGYSREQAALMAGIDDPDSLKMNAELRRGKPWYFRRMEPSGTILAIEPNGYEHVVKRGDMNTEAGRVLLESMTRALTSE